MHKEKNSATAGRNKYQLCTMYMVRALLVFEFVFLFVYF